MNSKQTIALDGVNTVFVHKDKCLLDALDCLARSRNTKIDTYADPQQFLAIACQYPQNIKIILGRTFDKLNHTGIPIAYHLHELGFKRLYLITFEPLMKHETPDYLINISNVDVDGLVKVLAE